MQKVVSGHVRGVRSLKGYLASQFSKQWDSGVRKLGRLSPFSSILLPLPVGYCKALKDCVNYGGANNQLIFGTGTLLSVKPST